MQRDKDGDEQFDSGILALLKVNYSQLVNALGPDTSRLSEIRRKPQRSLLLRGYKVCIYPDCGSCSDRYENDLDAAVLMAASDPWWSSLGMNKFQSLSPHQFSHLRCQEEGGRVQLMLLLTVIPVWVKAPGVENLTGIPKNCIWICNKGLL